MKISKEIKQSENVYTLYNIMELLYGHYIGGVPKHLEDVLRYAYEEFQHEITKDYPKDTDIIDCEVVEKIVFEGEDKSYQYPKEQISYYDLMTMYKDGISLPQKIELEIGKDKIIYKRYDDIDSHFAYYIINDESEVDETKSIMPFMSDCLNDSSCLDKIIRIIE